MRGYKVLVRGPKGESLWYVTWDYRNGSREEIFSEAVAYVERVYGPRYSVEDVVDIDTSPRF